MVSIVPSDRYCFTSLIVLLLIENIAADIYSHLTLAERIYINISGACRAVLSLQYNNVEQSHDLVDTMHILYLNDNVAETFNINCAYKSLIKKSLFDITKETKIIIHGFRDLATSDIPYELSKAYNEVGKYNVIAVDAEELLGNSYFNAVHNARYVGKRLANLLANLETYGANAEDFHLIGISLGAHVAGWTGKYFLKFKRQKLGRITGLDPAGPCFSYAYSDQRLDRSDALYVDVIHTNRMLQGILESVGHADFYVNGGGPHQPGCSTPSCSHLRASRINIESIRRPHSFIGVKCKSWDQFKIDMCSNETSVIGDDSSFLSNGNFYLMTSSEEPLGLGRQGLNYANF